jgi:hypothetical protein
MKASKFLIYCVIYHLFLFISSKYTFKSLYKSKFQKSRFYDKMKRYPFLVFLTGFTFSVIKELNPDLVNTEVVTMKDIQCMFKFIEKFWSNMINNRATNYIRNEIFKPYLNMKINQSKIALFTNINTYISLSKNIVKLTAFLWKKPIVKALVDVVKCSCNSTGNILVKTFSMAQFFQENSLSIFFSINFFEIPKLLYKVVSTGYSIYKTFNEKDPTKRWNLLGKTTGKLISLVFKIMRVI